jgi:ABC-type multidrug transport system ATPase subunit
MKQRLALAIALLGEPPVLVLDEVTASLDASGRERFVEMLGGLVRDGRRTVLFASHRPEEIATLATRVVTLDGGRISDDVQVTRDAAPRGKNGHSHVELVSPLVASRWEGGWS